MKKFFQILCFAWLVFFAAQAISGPFTYHSFSFNNPQASSGFAYRNFSYNNFNYHDFGYRPFAFNNVAPPSDFGYRDFTFNNPKPNANFAYKPFAFNDLKPAPHFSYHGFAFAQPGTKINITIYPRYNTPKLYRIVPQKQIVCGYADVGGLHDLLTGEYFPRLVKVCR